MRLLIFALLYILCVTPTFAESCQDRFAELLVSGNQEMGPVRLHLTQEVVGGNTSLIIITAMVKEMG